jgi:aminoglycoside phosphotransferase (APT) family kinase protein
LTVFPPAQGARIPWESLPASVREAVEGGLGERVVEAVTHPGGFSPGVAARLSLAGGDSAFVKAVGSSPNPHSPGLHRREAEIAAALPPETPAPRLLFAHDDGDWVALVFEDIPGREPELPWREQELERVLAAVADLSAALTPAPIEVDPFAQSFEEMLRGWRLLFEAGGGPGMDPWSETRLEALAELEAKWMDASAGETLIHSDVRADNILVTPERVVFVDWPHASLGAPWLELLCFLPSVAMQGGPKPWEIFDAHAIARDAPREHVDAVLAALAGFFVYAGAQAPPPGLPTLRDFQRAQGVEALAWLRRRLES